LSEKWLETGEIRDENLYQQPSNPMRNSTVLLTIGLALAGVLTAVGDSVMRVHQDPASGHWDITESGKPVLRYNYHTNQPGDILSKIKPDDLKYAQPRGDYFHPLYGLNGEVLTKDWALEHPHHRGIYWAWPEVQYAGQLGDLHALQRVFARPTGRCTATEGGDFARIEAENLWYWENREPIVRELTILTAHRAEARGRRIDLELRFTPIKDGVTLARRGTTHYGGLNLRMAGVQDQRITTNSATPIPRRAWADLSGIFEGSTNTCGIAILQSPTNPEYPGDWVQYPEINWLQPTFPTAGTRYPLNKNTPLTLRFQIWVHSGPTDATEMNNLWEAFVKTLNP
jgi:hypothetical protein